MKQLVYQSRLLLVVASASFAMSTLFSAVKPVWLTQFLEETTIATSVAGWLVAMPFIGIALASLFVTKLLANYSYRQIITMAGLLLVSSQLLLSFFYMVIVITALLQLLSGLMIGVLLGVTSTYIARSSAAGTLFGLVDMVGVLLMSIMIAGASFAAEAMGLKGSFWFSASMSFIFWLLMYAYKPASGEGSDAGSMHAVPINVSLRPVLTILMGVLFVTFSGLGFPFLFAMASELGMSYEQAGRKMGMILFLSGFACLLGGMCSARFGPEKPLAIVFVTCAIGWTTAIYAKTEWLYLLALLPAICTLQFSFPVLLALSGTLDNSGRWAAIATPILSSGFAWSAIVAALIVERSGIMALAVWTQAGMLVCMILLFVTIYLRRNVNNCESKAI